MPHMESPLTLMALYTWEIIPVIASASSLVYLIPLGMRVELVHPYYALRVPFPFLVHPCAHRAMRAPFHLQMDLHHVSSAPWEDFVLPSPPFPHFVHPAPLVQCLGPTAALFAHPAPSFFTAPLLQLPHPYPAPQGYILLGWGPPMPPVVAMPVQIPGFTCLRGPPLH